MSDTAVWIILGWNALLTLGIVAVIMALGQNAMSPKHILTHAGHLKFSEQQLAWNESQQDINDIVQRALDALIKEPTK